MKEKKQIIIINGGTTFPEYSDYIEYLKNKKVSFERLQQITWKDTLQEKLGEDFHVINLEMPHKMNAKYEEWKIYFELYIPLFNDGVVLIGHSLGGIFLAKYLSENSFPKEIDKTVLVAAPYYEEGLDESLGDFVWSGDLEKLKSGSGNIVIVHGLDDPIVPSDHSQKYHDDIEGSDIMFLENRHHIIEDNFPEVVDIVLG